MVLRLLRPALNAINARGRKQLSSEKQLMVTLWFMATLDSYRYVFDYVETTKRNNIVLQL